MNLHVSMYSAFHLKQTVKQLMIMMVDCFWISTSRWQNRPSFSFHSCPHNEFLQKWVDGHYEDRWMNQILNEPKFQILFWVLKRMTETECSAKYRLAFCCKQHTVRNNQLLLTFVSNYCNLWCSIHYVVQVYDMWSNKDLIKTQLCFKTLHENLT